MKIRKHTIRDLRFNRRIIDALTGTTEEERRGEDDWGVNDEEVGDEEAHSVPSAVEAGGV